MTAPIHHFRFCPACGKPLPSAHPPSAIVCAACNFLYHFNPAIAAGAIIVRPDGHAVFVRRARDPQRGKLALPGGFVEMGETAEESLRREIVEEVGLTVGRLDYLCSHVNAYAYRDVTYPVLDLFFTTRVSDTEQPRALDDVQSVAWLDPAQVDPAEIAFPSVREAVRQFAARLSHGSGDLPCASRA